MKALNYADTTTQAHAAIQCVLYIALSQTHS